MRPGDRGRCDRLGGDGDGQQEVLTVAEVARVLRLDRKSIYEAIQRDEIPGVRRIGRAIRVHRQTLLRWLQDGQGRVARSSGGRR